MSDGDDDVLTRFKQEIRITRRILHPNVVRTYDFGESGQLAYVAMEHVSGHFEPNDEVDEVRWLVPAAASALLTYPHDRPVVAALSDLLTGS